MKNTFIPVMLLCLVFLLVTCISITPDKEPPVVSAFIRLNSIGFLPEYKKEASIARECSAFEIRNAKNNKTVYTGMVTGPVESEDTQEQIYHADFSSFSKPGKYYLFIPGIGESARFSIDSRVYNDVFKTLMLGMFLWRCSTPVSATYKGTLYSHKAAHMNDGYLDFITGKKNDLKDGTGGWYDAGDYGKYIVNAGITTGMMFKAWELFQDRISGLELEIPEKGGPLPDYLDELKWEIDWVLKMQYPDGSGRVSHKLTARKFWVFLLPEFDSSKRYFVPWSSAATADFTAMLAMAARIYKAYDPDYAEVCLKAAKLSYDFLRENPMNHEADLFRFHTGEYQTTDPDDRLWAAAELWETTGEKSYLDDFEIRIRSMENVVITDFDWPEVGNLGVFTYLLSQRKEKKADIVARLKKELITAADSLTQTANAQAYGRPLGSTYYWGCNGTVARQTIILYMAYTISENREYITTMLDAIGHLFGRNYYGRSYVTGLGYNPPLHPHDRRSGGDDIPDPWPGYLIGGGHSATDWVDNQEDYSRNEIAINWNSALIFAVAAFVE